MGFPVLGICAAGDSLKGGQETLNVAFGSRLFSNSGSDVKLSMLYLPGSLFSPQ